MRNKRTLRAALLLAAAGLISVTAACGDDDDGGAAAEEASASSGDEAAFPVTIEHAFGETEIPEAPERVVTWGWGSTDAAIALGVVPVAIPFDDYAGDDDGILPWVAEALDEMGEDVPSTLPNTDEAPFEAIAAAQPDVILAAYSGITEEEYELLSDIAPVVAYPDEAWATPWEELIEIVGTALGKADEAGALLEEIDAEVAAQAEEHPELKGKSVAMVWDVAGTFYVYKPADPRVGWTLDLGMQSAESVEALGGGDAESTFYFTLSYEQLDELTSDILVTFADTQAEADTFLGSSQAKLLPQVAEGRVASVVGPEFIAAVSPPTALSLTWGMDEYIGLLSEAALAAEG